MSNMKKRSPESEILLAVNDACTRLELLGDQLDKIVAKLDNIARKANKILRLLRPNETKAPLPSEIVGSARPHTNTPPRSIYNTAPRQYAPTTPKTHPTLGSL